MERFFVIAADGQKYGPADVATLSVWVTEGRLLADYVVESEVDGRQMPARTVPGIDWPVVAPPVHFVDYPRPGNFQPTPLSWTEQQFLQTNVAILILASMLCLGPMFIFSIVGLIVCRDPQARRNALITLATPIVIYVSVGIIGILIAR